MPFAALLGFIFLLGLSGRRPGRSTYLSIFVAGVIATAWEYFG
jgi:hypothetical protein